MKWKPEHERGSAFLVVLLGAMVILVIGMAVGRQVSSYARTIQNFGNLPVVFYRAEELAAQPYAIYFSATFSPVTSTKRNNMKNLQAKGQKKKFAALLDVVNRELNECLQGSRSCLGRVQDFVLYEPVGTLAVAGTANSPVYYSKMGEPCGEGLGGTEQCPFYLRSTFEGRCSAGNGCAAPEVLAISIEFFRVGQAAALLSTSRSTVIYVPLDAVNQYERRTVEFECGTAVRYGRPDLLDPADPWKIDVKPGSDPAWFIPMGTPVTNWENKWWGIGCAPGFQRVGCSMYDMETGAILDRDGLVVTKDGDLYLQENGCLSDNEEAMQKAVVEVVCCRLR